VNIPILNIYYLLLYAWNMLEEGDVVVAGAEEQTDILELFGKVLDNGLAHLLRRGIDRNYVTHREAVSGIRGRIDFGLSLQRLLFPQGKAVCEYDELTHNVLQNQILKATVKRIVAVKKLDSDVRNSLIGKLRMLHEIEDIYLTNRSFRSIQLHRNNRIYALLLSICRLVHNNLLVNEDGSDVVFRDFITEDAEMELVFQRFILNFYNREQEVYEVNADTLDWEVLEGSDDDMKFVPGMQTDVTLTSTQKRIIIDCKYYTKTLAQHPYSGKESLHRGDLFQMFAYIMNAAAENRPAGAIVEGVLLYPTVSQDLVLDFHMGGHPFRIVTVNLNRHWKQIHRHLLGIIGL
jgi:5-methylcytosine-specific restriction enzyme subunit McrC